MSAEIIAKLGLSTERFSNGLQSANSKFAGFAKALRTQASSAGGDAGEAFAQKFSVKNQMMAAAVALGLSVRDISNKIAELLTGGSQEVWKEGLRHAEDAARIIEESTLRRMGTLQKIATLERSIARRQADESPKPRETPGFLASAMKRIGSAMPGSVSGAVAATFGKYLGTENEAEVFKRTQEARAKNLADEARVAELKEKQAADAERIAAARRELALVGATDEQKTKAIGDEIEATYSKLADATLKGKDSAELQVAVLSKLKTLKALTLEIDKKQTEEGKKQAAERAAALEKEAKARESFLGRYRAYLDAVERRSDAVKDRASARHDAIAFSVSEAAGGERGNASDRARARAIQRDEDRSRQLFDSGNTVTEFDPKTQRNVQRGANFFQRRAEQMRAATPRLTTGEQRPFAALEKKLDDANKHLAEMEKALKPANLKK